MHYQLDGKVIEITGGASGIGRAAALECARSGARVLVADQDAEGAEATAEMVRVEGAEAQVAILDVTDSHAQQTAVTQATEAWGRLDGAFNAAGIGGPALSPILELSEEDWARVLGVNLTGLWLSMRAQIAQMKKQGSGSIVNAASVAGLVGTRVNTAYSASKFGAVGITKSVALEYGAHNIRVNAVCPGWIETPMTAGFAVDQQAHANIAAAHLLGRTGQPEEVGALVAWLLSDSASFMTGAAIPIDGGMTAK